MVAPAREIDLGQCAYETQRKLREENGAKPTVSWEKLDPVVRNMWQAAALRVMDELGI